MADIPLVKLQSEFFSIPGKIEEPKREALLEDLIAKERPKMARQSYNVMQVIAEVLLEEAILRRSEDAFLSFSLKPKEKQHKVQLFIEMVLKTRPVVVFESKIPFLEEVIADIVLKSKESVLYKQLPKLRETASTKLEVPSLSDNMLMVLPMHSFSGIANENLVTHEITMTKASVFIGCSSFNSLSETIKSLTDVVLTLPDITSGTLQKILTKLYGNEPIPEIGNAGWISTLVPNDVVQAYALNLNISDTLAYLEMRLGERLKSVNPSLSPSLNDLHGLGEAKTIVKDIIEEINLALEGKIDWDQVDKGLLLAGPPGTGKTTLAKAIAKECSVKFININASKWQSTEHLGYHIESILNDFAFAKRSAPCILFIDEIDSIGARTNDDKNGYYVNAVVNTVLQEIQGFAEKENVIIIGATNREELVEPALKRAGRLERVVHVPYPNVDALEKIYDYYLKLHSEMNSSNINTKQLGGLSFGLTGADVEQIVRGGLRRARKEGTILCQQHIVDEITGKPRSNEDSRRIGKEEMERVSIHEAGHALMRYLYRDLEPVTYISIIPRSNGSLGFVAHLPSLKSLYSRKELLQIIEIMLAGRAAEELVYGKENISNGAGGDEKSDLAQATQLAERMIYLLGMGKNFDLFYGKDNVVNNEEAKSLLKYCYNTALETVKRNESKLKAISAVLMEKQEMGGEELYTLLKS
ncbi:MAG: AAA family ATPase [Draconibacterium sp.]